MRGTRPEVLAVPDRHYIEMRNTKKFICEQLLSSNELVVVDV